MSRREGVNDPLHGTAKQSDFSNEKLYQVHILKGDAYPAVLRVLDKDFLTQSSAVNLAWSPGHVTPYPRMRMKGLSGIHNR